MGRIKSTMVRKAASELFVTLEGFGEDFDKNKKILKGTMPSKKVRNKVAGQISRLAKQKRQKKHDRADRTEDTENTED